MPQLIRKVQVVVDHTSSTCTSHISTIYVRVANAGEFQLHRAVIFEKSQLFAGVAVAHPRILDLRLFGALQAPSAPSAKACVTEGSR